MIAPDDVVERLVGKSFDGWRVVEKLDRKATTGCNFSTGYFVVDGNGQKAFMKAFGYKYAFRPGADTAKELNEMTQIFLFEADLLKTCAERSMKYVIRFIAKAHVDIEGERISYIIMECADKSARNMIEVTKKVDYAWCLRSLHNVAVGIEEIHGTQVAHQDIKPSNVMMFDNTRLSKIGDFGRCSMLGKDMPQDALEYAGDPIYSPFELLYKEINQDWKIRRFSCDMFMLGNLIMTYFNNVSIVVAVLNKLGEDYFPNKWTGTFREILPYINKAFYDSVDKFNTNLPQKLRDELMRFIVEMCNPDPSLRGNPRKTGLSRFSLEYYISRLDYLAHEYEYSLKKGIIRE